MIGTIYNVILYKPTIPLVWLVKMGTNLTTTEVLMLSVGNFLLETLGEKHGGSTPLSITLSSNATGVPFGSVSLSQGKCT